MKCDDKQFGLTKWISDSINITFFIFRTMNSLYSVEDTVTVGVNSWNTVQALNFFFFFWIMALKTNWCLEIMTVSLLLSHSHPAQGRDCLVSRTLFPFHLLSLMSSLRHDTTHLSLTPFNLTLKGMTAISFFLWSLFMLSYLSYLSNPLHVNLFGCFFHLSVSSYHHHDKSNTGLSFHCVL